MKPKVLLTIVLLLFVVGTVGYAITKKLGEAEVKSEAEVKTKAAFVVFYFHGAKRCETCKKMEVWAREAVDQELSAELNSGDIEWRVVDISRPENEAIAVEFGVSYSNVAIAQVSEGALTRHKVLEQIWSLVDDKDAYLHYVTDELRKFMSSEAS